ncbi:MAG TPA: YbaB/EbfC family nucleoid-associated protein [bacterium]|nr:YbaB/EbfC family nucleoid-associated protein [bacterium]
MFDNLKQLAQLKQQANKIEQLMRSKIFESSSPNDEVKIKVNGKMELISIEIKEDILKKENKAYIEKIIKKTFSQCQKEVEKWMATEVGSQLGSFKLPF